jgi:hypothetical protein
MSQGKTSSRKCVKYEMSRKRAELGHKHRFWITLEQLHGCKVKLISFLDQWHPQMLGIEEVLNVGKKNFKRSPGYGQIRFASFFLAIQLPPKTTEDIFQERNNQPFGFSLPHLV